VAGGVAGSCSAGVLSLGAGVVVAGGSGAILSVLMESAAGLSVADLSAFSFWLSQAAQPSAPTTANATSNFLIFVPLPMPRYFFSRTT
jgi:hypothetical protein